VVKGKWQLELQLTNIYLAETKVNGVWGLQWVKTLGHIKQIRIEILRYFSTLNEIQAINANRINS